jgi:hypothetical protein
MPASQRVPAGASARQQQSASKRSTQERPAASRTPSAHCRCRTAHMRWQRPGRLIAAVDAARMQPPANRSSHGRHAHALRRARVRRQTQAVARCDGGRHEAALRRCARVLSRGKLRNAFCAGGACFCQAGVKRSNASAAQRTPKKWWRPAKARAHCLGAVSDTSSAGRSPVPPSSPRSTSQPEARAMPTRAAQPPRCRPPADAACAPDGMSMLATGGVPAPPSAPSSASKGGRGAPRKLNPNSASTIRSYLATSRDDASETKRKDAAVSGHAPARHRRGHHLRRGHEGNAQAARSEGGCQLAHCDSKHAPAERASPAASPVR